MRVITALSIFFVLTNMFAQLANAEFSKSDRDQLKSIIKEFILDNPEIVRDTLIALAAREEAARKEAGLARVRVEQGDPIMGNPNGTITIYEFSDYNCGYCKRFFETIQQALSDNLDLRLVVKEFPILNQSSIIAAKAGIAAQMQNKFDAYHIGMMNYRGQITNEVVMRIAQGSGLDVVKLQKDMESPQTASIIQRNREAAAALSINGTPGLVVGDNIIPGAIELDELQELIENERSKKG